MSDFVAQSAGKTPLRTADMAIVRNGIAFPEDDWPVASQPPLRLGIVGNLNRVKTVSLDVREAREPLFAAEELYGVIPADTRRPYDVREAIARIVDGSELDEFKQLYGQTLVCQNQRFACSGILGLAQPVEELTRFSLAQQATSRH